MKEKMSENNNTADISVNIELQCDIIDIDLDKISNMVKQVALRFGIIEAQINFIVADDEEIININKQFLDKSDATDVISFDLSDETEKAKLFDIAVNAQMAQRQAEKRGHSNEAEIALYFLHGLLHNLGFDDILSDDAVKMHKAEDEILKEFGYGVVYNKDSLD